MVCGLASSLVWTLANNPFPFSQFKENQTNLRISYSKKKRDFTMPSGIVELKLEPRFVS